MTTQYLNEEKPPVCLHELGQGLVNALHKEGRSLLNSKLTLKIDKFSDGKHHVATFSGVEHTACWWLKDGKTFRIGWVPTELLGSFNIVETL